MTALLEACAHWLGTFRLDDAPDDVQAIARTCLIDTVGVGLAGASTGLGRRATTLAGDIFGPGPATLFASPGSTLQAAGAAFANAVCAHALDFDDNCYAGVVHGSAVIVPATLAICQAEDLSGEEFLAAIIAGAETEYAVGQALGVGLYDRGWFTTAFLGPVGACAAACHALKLGRDRTANALGLAVAAAGGSKTCFGTDGKALLVGKAAEWGITAALMAARGLTGPADALEGARGIGDLANGGMVDSQAIRQVGRRWYLRDPGIDIKPIPVCLSSHTAVDATLHIVRQHGLVPHAIQSIVCDVSPIVSANLKYADPHTPQENQFSLQFAIGCSLRFGVIRLEHLQLIAATDPQLGRFMQFVRMTTTDRWQDPALRQTAPEGAFVTVRMLDGTEYTHFVSRSKGTASSPLSSAEIDDKFTACASSSYDDDVSVLLEQLHNIEQIKSLRSLAFPSSGYLQAREYRGPDL